MKNRYVNIDIDKILREQREDLDEGMFSSALKTAAINMVPGGRMVADYTRARGFDELEDAAEMMENRMESLEERIAQIERLLAAASGGSYTP